ncbi:YdcF family protein [Pseudodesulfovibrio cashew]|uniref:YdcF family protein n=1 Tax=Pseudodesulfovibrio cashew TaxID=2678688 RepID=A0A6I6JLA8_9BACT|nr:ElyC/SanA/YdcF family protein [Pseudodesulfovibrio cashew]QGY41053.1 YdcF family protein [Pseudodesulfovibrio cashew]
MKKLVRAMLQAIGALTVVVMLAGVGLAAFAGYWMRVDEPPIKADYIFPLAGNDNRLIEAVELYKQGYAPVILISMSKEYPPTPLDRTKWLIGFPDYPRMEFVRRLVSVLGGDTKKLEPFGNGHVSTLEEIEALKKHLNGKRVSLLVVTSPEHTKRVKIILDDLLPECDITVMATKEGAFETKWWKDQRSAQRLIMEFAKTLYYLAGGAYRSTD